MKKNLKKLFALLLVVVMVAAIFAGCASNTEKPAETTTPSDTTETTTTEETTPALLCRGAWVSQYIFAPAGMWGSSMRRWSFSTPSSWWTALISMPQESMPIMGLGGRFTMATHVFPTNSSGS